MGLAEILTQFWGLVADNPIPFILVVAASFGLGFSVAKTLDRSAMETLRQRLGAAKDQLDQERNSRLSGDSAQADPTALGKRHSDLPESPHQERAESPPLAVASHQVGGGEDGEDDDNDEDFVDLEEQEEEVLQLLATHGPLPPFQLSGALGVSEQKALLHCERLADFGFVSWTPDVGKGAVFMLNRAGREFLDRNDMLE